jgi:hypothetical protein
MTMKTTLLTLFSCFAILSANAQVTYVKPTLKNNGKPVPVSPQFNRTHTVFQNPPCYIYKKNNLEIMECPGIQFAPEDQNIITRNTESTYLGYYPKPESTKPATEDCFANDIPELQEAGKRIPVTPSFDRPYTVIYNPPCYMYRKNTVVVMECPGIQFGPEDAAKK